MTAPLPAEVAEVFGRYPAPAREGLLQLRALVLALAEERAAGPLTETLKWGAPAYLTQATKSGSTIRLGLLQGRPAVFFNCNTTLVEGFRADFPDAFAYSGNRALLPGDGTGDAALAICLGRALTYHRDKKRRRA